METKSSTVITPLVHIAPGNKRYVLLSKHHVHAVSYSLSGVGTFSVEGAPPEELLSEPRPRVRTLVATLVKKEDKLGVSKIPGWASQSVIQGMRDDSLIVEYLDQTADTFDRMSAKSVGIARYGIAGERFVWIVTDSAFVKNGQVVSYLAVEPYMKGDPALTASLQNELNDYLSAYVHAAKWITYTAEELRALVQSLPQKPPAYQWRSAGELPAPITIASETANSTDVDFI